MLTRLLIRGFRSLRDVELTFGRLTVFCGPNDAGKSSLLDVVDLLPEAFYLLDCGEDENAWIR